jgi:hypothetical protein
VYEDFGRTQICHGGVFLSIAFFAVAFPAQHLQV